MSAQGGEVSAISARLAQVTSELRRLEQDLTGQAVDARVLTQFRDAVNHVRRTAWAVQQWLELRDQKGDTFTVTSILAAERVRVVAQLAKDVCLDLDGNDVTIATEGITDMISSVNGLSERLQQLVKRGS